LAHFTASFSLSLPPSVVFEIFLSVQCLSLTEEFLLIPHFPLRPLLMGCPEFNEKRLVPQTLPPLWQRSGFVAFPPEHVDSAGFILFLVQSLLLYPLPPLCPDSVVAFGLSSNFAAFSRWLR